ncbi:MAG: allantoinase AllB [Lentisphaerae bacterium]|nr:allantoinase AllB [Lentisphaerota bacterium]
MPIALQICGATVVTPASVAVRDLYVENGQFVDGPAPARVQIDARGLLALPGLIDSHLHFNDPGRADWEGIATGSAALAAGGGTCFFDMPLNSSPPTLDGPSFDLKLAAAQAAAVTDFGLWGGLTPANLDRMEELAVRGVVGFKAFMCPSGIPDFQWADEATLRRGMARAARLKRPVAVHAESPTLTARLTAEIRARGGRAVADYLASRPPEAEWEAIEQITGLARETGCRLHIVHVSTSRGVDLVQRAAADGVDVTCETCPHYLALNADDMMRLGPRAKCAPPLRPAAECEALWRDLREGRIAFVASDHSPSPASMKASTDVFENWGGIAGVQSTLAIVMSHEPALPVEAIAGLTATRVADRYRLVRKGRIATGCDADLVLIEPGAMWTLRREDLLDRHKLSPYAGLRFRGRVRRTIMRGQTVCVDGRIVAPACGRLVTPAM